MRSPKNELPSVRLRMIAGEMLARGESVATVCKVVGIAKPTARRYQRIVAAQGLDALAKLEVGGRRSVLSEETLKWIAEIARAKPQVYGFEGEYRTSGTLGKMIEREIGIAF